MEEETEHCICDVCSKSFQSEQELRAHKAIHRFFQKAFKCHICPRSFQTNQILQKHLLTHSDDKPFHCHLCEKSFKSKGSLIIHLSGHRNERSHICMFCEKGFNNTQALRRHIKIHTGEKKKEDHTLRYVECEICQQKCTRGYGMRVHMMIHTGEKPLECKTCGRRFRKKSDLRTHELIHSGVRSHVCEVCGKGFYILSIKRKHMLTHVGQNPEKIKTKRLYRAKRRNLNGSLNDKHGGVQGRKCELDNKKQIYTCDFCEEQFQQLKTLREHIFSHDVEELKPYLCEICNKRFPQKFDLKRHMITHEERKPFMCAICEAGVSTLHALRKHVERHNISNYICESETSRSPQKYFKHQNKKGDTDNPSTPEDQIMSDTTDGEGHLSVKSEVIDDQISPINCKINVDCQDFQIDAGIQAYMCGICSFRTCTLNILNVHIKEHEADSRPRECHVCQGIFDEKEDFDDHNCAEEIVKPKNFNCDICKTSFDNFSSLQLHKCSVDDGKNRELPQKIGHIFKCTTCKATFSDVLSLTNHVQIKHSQNPKSHTHVLSNLENEPDENEMEIDEQEVEDVESGLSGDESGESDDNHADQDKTTCFVEIQAPEENVDNVTTSLDSKSQKNDEKLPENKKNESHSKTVRDSEKHGKNNKDSSAVTGNNISGINNKAVQLTLASYSCEVCNQVFPRWKMLYGHMTSCHMVPKPFMCGMCPDTFSTTLDLRKHLSVHKSS